MAHMIVLDAITEDLFICGGCKTIFYCVQSFFDHKRFCCGKKPPVVEDSMVNSSERSTSYVPFLPEGPQESDLKEDEIKTSRVDDLSCMDCKKKFKKLKYLHAHRKLHSEPLQCSVCGRCFDNNSHLKRHTNSHKVWPDSLNATTAKSFDVDLLSYTCSYCNLVLSNYSQFRTHLNNHLSIKKYKCIQGDCNSFFDTFESLLSHVSTCHNNPNYTCNLCKMYFSSLDEIGRHYQNHSQQDAKDTQCAKKTTFKCTTCCAVFKRPEKLSLHQLTENHKKSCIHCGKTFVSSKRLRMHLQIHKEPKTYKCTLCGSSFQLKKYLMAHMLKHGERQFTCSICDKAFRRQDILHRHKKTHLAHKTFICPFKQFEECTKEFTRKDKLKEHMRSHVKRLKTTVCKEINTENISTEMVESRNLPCEDGASITERNISPD